MPRIARNDSPKVTFQFAGETVQAFVSDSVAAALLGAGHIVFRATPVSAAPRGPLCMMGVCFDCLVEIDGVANQQACMHTVRDGMRIERQNGAFDAEADEGSAPLWDEETQ